MCILYFLLVKKCQNLLFCYVWVCTLGNPQFVVVFSRLVLHVVSGPCFHKIVQYMTLTLLKVQESAVPKV